MIKVCQEEFHWGLGLIRRRDENEELLLPVYLHSAQLPVHMRAIQFIDARKGDANKITHAAQQLAAVM